MANQDKSIHLLRELIKTTDSIGFENTKKLISEARHDVKEQLGEQETIDILVELICREFKISKPQLLLGTSKGNRVDALMVLFVICATKLEYSQTKISKKFNRSKATISINIKKFFAMKLNSKEQELLVIKKNKVLEKLSKN